MICQKWWGRSGADWNGFGKNRAAMETGGAGYHGGLVMIPACAWACRAAWEVPCGGRCWGEKSGGRAMSLPGGINRDRS